MSAEPPRDQLKLIVESILFVAGHPVEIAALARICGMTPGELAQAVSEMSEEFQGRGVRIQRTGDAIQMVTAPESTPYVQQFLGVNEDYRLSPVVLAALTIIAYKQPITRADIERVLGKSCDWALATLRARDLIAEVGRAPTPGRPYLYGTTFRFLEYFGLEKPADLPPLPELEQAPAAWPAVSDTGETGEPEEAGGPPPP
jgi:segregation and condensation protein B